MNDPTLYATLIGQLRDQIRHHEQEARKARAALQVIKNLLGGTDPTRSKEHGGTGIQRKELGRQNRARVDAYFEANPTASMWGASKALDLTYNTVMRHRRAFHADRPSGN